MSTHVQAAMLATSVVLIIIFVITQNRKGNATDRQTDRFNPAGAPYGTLRRSPPRYFTRVRLGFSTRAWRLTGVPRLSVGPERLTPHPIRVAPVCRAVLQGLSVLRVVGSTPCVCVREK